jgi:hypothetical protein
MLLADLFRLEKKSSVVLFSLLLSTFPLNACYWSYTAGSETCYYALVFSVLAIWLMEKRTIGGNIGGVVALICSMAVYQSFFSVSIGLVFILFYIRLIRDDINVKTWCVEGVKATMKVGIALIVYLLITKLLLSITGVALQSSGHEDQLFELNTSTEVVHGSLYDAVENWVDWMYRNGSVFTDSWTVANVLGTLFVAGVVIYQVIKLLKKKRIAQIIWICLLTLMIPVMLNNIYVVMNGRKNVHSLMHYCIILIYFMFIAIFDQFHGFCKDMKIAWINVLTVMAIGSLALIIYNGFIVSNQIYLHMDNNMNALNDEMTAIVSSLSSLEGYTMDTPVYFANCDAFMADNYTEMEIWNQTIDSEIWIGTGFYNWNTERHLFKYLQIYMQLNLPQTDEAQREQILASDEYQDMQVFPEGNSVRMIDGVAVIKMGAE